MRIFLILITLFLTFTVSVQSTEQTNEKKMKTTLDETINNEKKIKATLDEAADIVKDLTTAAELEVSGTVTDLTRESFYQLTKAIKSQKNTIKLNLTKINGLNKIEKKTFEKCSNLQEITLPNNITYIGYRAFADCSTLSNIIIPDSVTSIGYQAFSGCTKLTGVTIGNGITRIEESTFLDCKSVETLIIGNKVTSFENLPMTSALKLITIGNGITFIDNTTFNNSKNIQTITIGSSVTTIGSNTFTNCKNLTSVNFQYKGNWYFTDNSNYTDGTKIDVSDPAGNAINLRKNYCKKYWYSDNAYYHNRSRYY